MLEITIVVPVYRVERYLHRCLESIREQTYADYECILVDDASPDNCPAICDEYAGMDKRFKVIHKAKNEGLSAARMTGLKYVKTKYVMHIDSDDSIERNTLELLIKKAKGTNAEITIGSFRRIIKNKYHIIKSPPVKTGIESLEYFFIHKQVSLCGKLYKTELFENIEVSPFNIGEDAITNVMIFSKIEAKDITNLDEVVYNYYLNENSMLDALKKDPYVPFDKCSWFVYRKWIGDYINARNVSSCVIAAYHKYLTESISIFLLNSGVVKKSDLAVIYSYYKTFNKKHINKLIRIFIFSYCKFPFVVSGLLFIYRQIKLCLNG
jgi:glycosyltransferase involved in cell wall biosynthesis